MSKKSVMRDMQQADELIHTIGSRQADELAKAKLVRKVTMQPEAGQGRTHVSLTARGRAWKGDTIEPVEPDPVVEVDTGE